MNNPIFNALNQNNMMVQFDEFKKTFTGDPKEEVQKLLNSGRMSQSEFNRLSQMANQLRPLFFR